MNQPSSDSAGPATVPSALSPKVANLYAGLGYLAIVFVLFHRLLFGDVLSPSANLWADVPFRGELKQDLTPYMNGVQGDVFRYFESAHVYQYRSVRQGRFPLWNPHIFCGFPFHANGQSAMLSPFHWLYFVVNPKWAAGPMAALRLWVAGFGAFCLGRRLGMLPSAAFVSGVAWMLCAFNVRWLPWNVSAVAAWLPVVLFALDRLIEQVSVRRLALAGLVMTAFQLSGHPETQFQAGALSGLFVLSRVWFRADSVAVKLGRVAVCLAAHVLGLLGAGVALVPFLDQLPDSSEWHEATRAFRRWLPAEALFGLVAPDHFGRPRAGRFYQGPQNYNEAGLYFGLMPLALAVTALVAVALRPKRTIHGPAGQAAVIFSVWIVFCGAIVFGVPGVFALVHLLPVFSKLDNLRMILGVQFGGAMLAGVAWTQLCQVPSRAMTRTFILTSWLLAAAVGYLLVAPDHHAAYSHTEGLFKLWTDSSVPSQLEHRSLRTLVSFVAALACACFATVFARRLPRNVTRLDEQSAAEIEEGSTPRLARPMLFIACIDLVFVAYGFTPLVPPHVIFPVAPPELARVVEDLHGARLVATEEILAPNLAMVYGFRDLRGYDFPLDRRWAKLYQRLGWQTGITLLPHHQVSSCVRPQVQSVFDKCCVRYLYTRLDRDDPGKAELFVCNASGIKGESLPPWTLVHRGTGAAEDLVYKNPTAYPRVYFAERFSQVAPAAALDVLLDVSHDLRKESVVEEQVAGFPSDPDDGLAGGAAIERDGEEELTIRTSRSRASLLVVSDRFDHNWRVQIDGQPAKPIRANFLFRGVVVPAGEHVVRWAYRPKSFSWGAAISAVTLVALLLCWIQLPSTWFDRRILV